MSDLSRPDGDRLWRGTVYIPDPAVLEVLTAHGGETKVMWECVAATRSEGLRQAALMATVVASDRVAVVVRPIGDPS